MMQINIQQADRALPEIVPQNLTGKSLFLLPGPFHRVIEGDAEVQEVPVGIRPCMSSHWGSVVIPGNPSRSRDDVQELRQEAGTGT